MKMQTSDARIHQLKLDITNERDVTAAVEACQDVTILMNTEVVAANTIQGILAGQEEILADQGTQDGGRGSQDVKGALAHDRHGFYQSIQNWNGQ